jgi:hypothetical protein
MYPDDQEPPTNRSTIGEAPQPFVYGQPEGDKPKPKKKGSNLWWLPWAISGVLLAVVLVVSIVLLAKNANNGDKDKSTIGDTTKQKETKEETTTGDECTSKQRRYQNDELSIAFCYPTAWGDVKVSDGKLDPSDDGTRIRLSFADKAAVHLGLVSDDWATDVARDGSCTDPSVQAFPDTSTFSAKWVTEPATGAPNSAIRGLEVVPDEFLIQEQVDNLLTNGVCLEGYNAFGGKVYRNAAATYSAKFNAKITTPQQHITDPTELIPAADRSDFITFVKSIRKL